MNKNMKPLFFRFPTNSISLFVLYFQRIHFTDFTLHIHFLNWFLVTKALFLFPVTNKIQESSENKWDDFQYYKVSDVLVQAMRCGIGKYFEPRSQTSYSENSDFSPTLYFR